MVGSLIKNPGGGLAPTGGYICGRADLIERCARRLTAPGLGREVGANLGLLTRLLPGLFPGADGGGLCGEGCCIRRKLL